MDPIKPDFFIVGAPKSATTAMMQYLAEHPEVCFARSKEIHYFGSDLNIPNRIGTLDAYLDLFSHCDGKCRIGDASVMYLFSKKAAEEIHDFAPQARIIIMLRNPMEMMYSLYYQTMFNGDETLLTFEEALAAEEERVRNNFIQTTWYRRVACYSEQVERYYEVFGRDAVQVIIYDDLKADTARVYRATLDFLQVDSNFQPAFRVVNPNSRIRSPLLRDFVKHPPRWYSLFLTRARAFAPASLRQKLNLWLKESNSIYEVRPPMNPDLRRQLQQEFWPEIERLSQLLERDLSFWRDA